MMNNPEPRKVQHYVRFNLIYYFCRRGRQNIHDFKLDTFKIAFDPDGTRYVYQHIDELDTNHGIDDTLAVNDGRMYEARGTSSKVLPITFQVNIYCSTVHFKLLAIKTNHTNSFPDNPMCPVNWFDLYTKKLHPNFNHLWQRPKRGIIHYTDDLWFDNVRVGHDPIENFMANLSKEAGLSCRYTNHSIRCTVMGLLGEKYEGQIVIGLSGHKSEQTVKQYIKCLPAKKKREMSEYLNENIQPKNPKLVNKFTFKANPTATISKAADETPLQPLQVQDNQKTDDPLQEFHLENVEQNPPDDVLLNFLAQFNVPQNQDQAVVPAALAVENNPPLPQPVVRNNTMNISNVSNIQNVQENKPQVPTMYFGGHASLTINYNFAPIK